MHTIPDLLRAINHGHDAEAQDMVRKGLKVTEGCAEDIHTNGGVTRLLPKGTTALHIAALGGHADLLRFLIDYTKEVAPEDSRGMTPLQVSMDTGRKTLSPRMRDSCMKIIKALIEWGSILRVADWPGLCIGKCHPEWELDSLARTCPGRECGRKFTLTVRRHHCRGCGHVFCGSCAYVCDDFTDRCCNYCRSVTSLWKARIMLNESAGKS
eukprot:TRINITY_DN9486_c0_g2_i1.p1 TRINITY_DN9486_c0_g2~~TRINITY_DN9486_c0_g2_i1.p1  ORF type:complete len:211 (+),score=62.61 TRINITY_DN9486_c0_g2_i1:108-740(+)